MVETYTFGEGDKAPPKPVPRGFQYLKEDSDAVEDMETLKALKRADKGSTEETDEGGRVTKEGGFNPYKAGLQEVFDKYGTYAWFQAAYLDVVNPPPVAPGPTPASITEISRVESPRAIDPLPQGRQQPYQPPARPPTIQPPPGPPAGAPAGPPPDAPVRSALSGELGVMPNPYTGGYSSELSVTVTEDDLNQGRPTNIPMLVKGQSPEAVERILKGESTWEDMRVALTRARDRQTAGEWLPSYTNMAEAVTAAKARSDAKPEMPEYTFGQDDEPIGERPDDEPVYHPPGGEPAKYTFGQDDEPVGTDRSMGRVATARNLVGQGVAGVPGALLKTIGTRKALTDQAALDALDALDAGKKPDFLKIAADDRYSLLRYERMPEERAAIRREIEGRQTDPRESALFQAGVRWDMAIKDMIKVNPEFAEDFWWGKVPNGFGWMFGFMLTGLVTRGLGVGVLAGAAGAGAGIGYSHGFEDAMISGATFEQAYEMANLNAILGLSEGLPIMRLLDRINKTSGGLLSRALKNAWKSGAEEAIQEGGQSFGLALGASKLVGYDPNRSWWEGVGEGAGVGFTNGALMALLATLFRGRRAGSPAPPAPRETGTEAVDRILGRGGEETPRDDTPIPAEDVLGADVVGPEEPPPPPPGGAASTARPDAGATGATPPPDEGPPPPGAPPPPDAPPGAAGATISAEPADMRRAMEEALEEPPIPPSTNIDSEVQEAEVPKSPEQAAAGNYKKGHIQLHGLEISIETPKGEVRSGVDADGKPWSVEMPAHYGYIRGTEGADGDQVDVYVGPNLESDSVFIIDQVDLETRQQDEHKVFMGFAAQWQVEQAYEAAFDDGSAEKRMAGITEMSVSEFRAWVEDRQATKKPLQPPRSINLGIGIGITPKKQKALLNRVRKQLVKEGMAPERLGMEKMGRAWLLSVQNATEAEELHAQTVLNTEQDRHIKTSAAAAHRARNRAWEGPMDLVTFIRTQGGITDPSGDFRAADVTNQHRRAPYTNREWFLGPLIKEDGNPADEIGLLGFQAGYYRERPTEDQVISDVIDSYHARDINSRRWTDADLEEIAILDYADRAEDSYIQAADEGKLRGYDPVAAPAPEVDQAQQQDVRTNEEIDRLFDLAYIAEADLAVPTTGGVPDAQPTSREAAIKEPPPVAPPGFEPGEEIGFAEGDLPGRAGAVEPHAAAAPPPGRAPPGEAAQAAREGPGPSEGAGEQRAEPGDRGEAGQVPALEAGQYYRPGTSPKPDIPAAFMSTVRAEYQKILDYETNKYTPVETSNELGGRSLELDALLAQLGEDAQIVATNVGARLPAAAPITEKTDQGQQLIIPGAERISEREEAERRMDEPLRPTVGQKRDAGELFEPPQEDLIDRIRREESGAKKPKAQIPDDEIYDIDQVNYSVLAPEFADEIKAAAQLQHQLIDRLTEVGLNKSIAVNVAARIVAVPEGDWTAARPAWGLFTGDVIRVSLESAAPLKTFNHEIIHALRNLGLFTAEEWGTLEGAAETSWLERYDIPKRYAEQHQGLWIEEAIADAYADYRQGQMEPGGKVKRLFSRMTKFFDAIARAWRKVFDQVTPEDVFAAIDRGEMARRPQRPSPRDLPQPGADNAFQVEGGKQPQAFRTREGALAHIQRYGGRLIERQRTQRFEIKGRDRRPGKGADNAYERRAQQLLDFMHEKFGHRFTPLGKLPEQQQYLIERYLTLGGIDEINEIAENIDKTFRKASKEDQGAIYEYLTTRGADSSTINSPKARRGAIHTKKIIDSVGRNLVAKGMLSEEAYSEHRGAYLPRVYLKHLWGTPATAQGQGGLKRSAAGYLKERKDIPKDVREIILGEITDPGYLAARGVMLPSRDLVVLDFLERVSKNDTWVLPKTLVKFEGHRVTPYWLKSEASRIRRQSELYKPDVARRAMQKAADMDAVADAALHDVEGTVPDDYKQIPNSPRYGRLRGMYVRKEIHNDIVGAIQFVSQSSNFLKSLFEYGGLGTTITQIWKIGKVALNPPTQFRNFFSNGVLLQISGVPFHRVFSGEIYIKAIREIRNDGPHWRIAKKYGVRRSTLAHNELYRIERAMLRAKSKKRGMAYMFKDIAAAVLNGASDVYGLTEAMGKTAKIIDAMEREGKTEEQAVLDAHNALFDYSLVPGMVQWLRNSPTGSPFITFYYKSAGQIINTAVKHPTRYLPWVLLPYAMAQFLMLDLDIDEEDLEALKKALPEWLQERSGVFILPWKDAHGRWQPINFSYFLPWAEHIEAIKAAGGADIQALKDISGILGGPVIQLPIALDTNIDPFTKRQIVNQYDPPAKRAADWMTYIWSMAMPSWMTDRGVAGHLSRAITGEVNRYGDPGLTTTQAALRAIGVNIYPVEPEQSRGINLRRRQHELNEITRRWSYALRDQSLTPAKRKRIDRQFRKMYEQRVKEYQEYLEESELPPALQ